MANIQTSIICIRDFLDGRIKYNAGMEYFYFKNNYDRIFYQLYTVRRDVVSTINYDQFKDNFIELTELDKINKHFNSFMDV